MDDINQIIATDVNEDFEREISLHRLIGNRPAVDLLKVVVEQYQNDYASGHNPKLSPVILIGNQSRLTMVRALSNSFGNLNFVTISAYFLSQYVQSVNDFFVSNDKYATYYISDLELLNAHCQLQLYKILKYKRISVLDKEDNTWSQVGFRNRLIILSAAKLDGLSSMLLNEAPFKINLGQYSNQEIFEILKQRTSLLNWSISEEEILRNIAMVSGGEVRKAIELLKMSYFVMRSKGEDVLEDAHFNKALHLLDKI